MSTQITRLGLAAGPSMVDMRGLNPNKKARANNTESPRTRDGAKYPGGRAMRRALKRLADRQNNFMSGTTKGGHSHTKAGSMTR